MAALKKKKKKVPLLLFLLRGTTFGVGGITLMRAETDLFLTLRDPPPCIKMTAVFGNIFHLEFIIPLLPSPIKMLNMKLCIGSNTLICIYGCNRC